jgi:hypothetical protein
MYIPLGAHYLGINYLYAILEIKPQRYLMYGIPSLQAKDDDPWCFSVITASI